MGRKRNADRSDEEIRKKIRKLQNQLAQRVATNPPVEEKLCDFPPMEPVDTLDVESKYEESPEPGHDQYQYDDLSLYPMSSRLPSLEPPSPRAASPALGSQTQQPLSPSPQPTTSAMPLQTAATAVNKITEEDLEEEILQLLGDAPQSEAPRGPPIHKDVARRWEDILTKGLPKEAKDSLFKEYLVPENCDLLTPATLNPEVKAALPETLVKRDASLVYKQKQMAVAISALASATNMVLASETSKKKLLKPLSDACRILCDQHYGDTNTRRKFVISSINSKLRNALTESKRDKFLFGENVSEKLKAAKTIQQSSDALKTPRPKPQRSVPSTSGYKGRLNFAPQHRKTDSKPSDARQAANPTYRQSTTNNSRRPTDRPLPPPVRAPQRR